MTRLAPEDLPPHLRERILAENPDLPEHLRKVVAGRKSKSRAGISENADAPGRCQCGEAFPTASAWIRHSDAHGAGHRVWSVDLPPVIREETP